MEFLQQHELLISNLKVPVASPFIITLLLLFHYFIPTSSNELTGATSPREVHFHHCSHVRAFQKPSALIPAFAFVPQSSTEVCLSATHHCVVRNNRTSFLFPRIGGGKVARPRLPTSRNG